MTIKNFYSFFRVNWQSGADSPMHSIKGRQIACCWDCARSLGNCLAWLEKNIADSAPGWHLRAGGRGRYARNDVTPFRDFAVTAPLRCYKYFFVGWRQTGELKDYLMVLVSCMWCYYYCQGLYYQRKSMLKIPVDALPANQKPGFIWMNLALIVS